MGDDPLVTLAVSYIKIPFLSFAGQFDCFCPLPRQEELFGIISSKCKYFVNILKGMF